MNKNQIDFETQIQIKKYMDYLSMNELQHINKAEKEIFNKLTPNLKEAFLLQTIGKMIFSLPLFAKNFSESFLKEVLLVMKPVYFEPNTFIYKVKNNYKVFKSI